MQELALIINVEGSQRHEAVTCDHGLIRVYIPIT